MNVVNIPESTVKDLKLMETYFGKIKAKKDIESSCRAIERILHRVFDINAKINIIDTIFLFICNLKFLSLFSYFLIRNNI